MSCPSRKGGTALTQASLRPRQGRRIEEPGALLRFAPVESQSAPGPVPFGDTTISPSVINSLSLPSFTFPSPNRSPSPSPSHASSHHQNFSIPVLSLNCHRANYIGHAVLNSLVDKTAILLFQEPWLGKIGSSRSDDVKGGLDVYGMVHQQHWQQFIPVPHYAGLDRPIRVTAYVNKILLPAMSVSIRTDIIEDPDIMILDFRSSFSNFWIINIYNDENNTAVRRLLTLNLPTDIAVTVTGDFNLHHPHWSLPETPESAFAETVVDWMEDHNFTLINFAEEITFRRGISDQSVIDLTWANRQAVNLISGWEVIKEAAFASDHLPILWAFASDSPPTTITDTNCFTFSEKRRDGWVDVFRDALATNRPALLDNPDPDSLELITNHLLQALITTSERKARAKKAKAEASPWFTAEVQTALAGFRHQHVVFRSLRGRSHHNNHTPTYITPAYRELKK